MSGLFIRHKNSEKVLLGGEVFGYFDKKIADFSSKCRDFGVCDWFLGDTLTKNAGFFGESVGLRCCIANIKIKMCKNGARG